jgi:3-hydroxyisobutyrate dehydrogenase-like beta-hydroxyacid dehydrogenase
LDLRMTDKIGIVGFGEAGQAFAAADGWRGDACAYDKLTHDPATRAAKESDYRRAGVEGAPDIAATLADASLVLSLVTADQALEVASSAAAYVARDTIFCDLNSVAPATKQAGAKLIEAAGARYVDVAIMAPVHPARLGVPLLLSGPAAPDAQRELAALGFTNVRVVGTRVGQASAIKMIRSVIVKGIEALTAEAMLAADAAGVVNEVLASLDESDRRSPWAERADYNLDRMMVHGLRRAAEMEEVAKTLDDLGVEPLMTEGTVAWERQIGSERVAPATGLAAKIAQVRQRKADAA